MGQLFGSNEEEPEEKPAARLIRPRRRGAGANGSQNGGAVDTEQTADAAPIAAPEAERIDAEQDGIEQAQVEQAQVEQPRVEQARLAQARAEARAEQARLALARLEQESEAGPAALPPNIGERSVPAPAARTTSAPRAPTTSPPRAPTTSAPRAPTTSAPAGPRHRRGHAATSSSRRTPFLVRRWKSIAAGLIVLVVIATMGRTFVGNFTATKTQSPLGQPGTTPNSIAAPAPPPLLKPVFVNGKAILPAGAVITLNPALAQPGSKLNVSGSGFDAGSMVDLVLGIQGVKLPADLGSARVDKYGSLYIDVAVPADVSGATVVVTAKQRNSNKVATAEAATASGIGTVDLGKTLSGKPGDLVSLSARGFFPGEPINIYWGRVSGVPAATVQADTGGGVGQASVRVGTGVVGQSTLVLIGAKSGTAATAPFYMLGLYPSVLPKPYAVKPLQTITLSGKGFAPGEPVRMYLNSARGVPLTTSNADSHGSVSGVTLQLPYGLKGKQFVLMTGELSRASGSAGFTVLPYTPSVQPSTYGGSPGTSFSFFATGFGPNEVVDVYLGGQGAGGELVSAFRVNDKGAAGAAGSFQVSATDSNTLTFSLVGRQSGGQASASFKVSPATGPVGNLPPRQKYVLPPDLAQDLPSGPGGAVQPAPGSGGADQPGTGPANTDQPPSTDQPATGPSSTG